MTEIEDGDLSESANPQPATVYAGCFPGLTVVCSDEFALDNPSELHDRILTEAKGRTVYLHAMHSVVDWFAYAMWSPDGELVRSLSLSPDSGIAEDIGTPLPFEIPYWAGEHAEEEDEEDDDHPFPFHPLDLAEAALQVLFGFQFEGVWTDDTVDVSGVVLSGFEFSRD